VRYGAGDAAADRDAAVVAVVCVRGPQLPLSLPA